ncbi:hypothetical protein ALQ38_05498 [Pseudomonas marginalis pv. marginalis]|nr:hypothetical protein ALQ38_05498 [Pseudomonas marginalis pv. marginalis]
MTGSAIAAGRCCPGPIVAASVRADAALAPSRCRSAGGAAATASVRASAGQASPTPGRALRGGAAGGAGCADPGTQSWSEHSLLTRVQGAENHCHQGFTATKDFA